MAINKNFVVKNGFEVNQNLILANATTNKVGIGTSIPQYTLHVLGGIGATDARITGVATVLNELRVGTGGTIFSVIAGPTGFGQSVGVGTASPAFLLDVRSPVSTGQTALYVQGDVRITGDLNVDDLVLDQVTLTDLNLTGIATIATLGVSGVTTTKHLQVTGVSTFVGVSTFNSSVYVAGITTFANYAQFLDGQSLYFGNGADLNINHDGFNSYIQEQGQGNLYIQSNGGSINIRTNSTENAFVANQDGSVELYYDNSKKFETISTGATITGTLFTNQLNSSGVATASTYYGDGSNLTGNARNLTATIGIGTSSGVVGYGVSFLDLRGPGLSTAYYDSNVGVATIYFQGGGGGATIGIGTTPGEAFVGVVTAGNLWYNSSLGRTFIYYQDTDSAQWVDASPSNVGVITSLINVSFAPGSAVSPSMYFVGDTQTGFFSPGAGQFTVVSTGSSILNINPSGINVTGIATAQDFDALSDQNYKENVTTVNNALLKVEQLRGVKFDWKESGLPSYGVIAQELEQVLPELVHGNDPKTVNYNGIIGVLIEAIKELKAEVEELKNAK